jgi:hypothetical protein
MVYRPATIIALADVIVGERHRVDMGDIECGSALGRGRQ